MRLTLQQWAGDTTWIEWDPAHGSLSGPAADLVRRLVKNAIRDGSVCTHPIPTCYDIADPLHDRGQMAVVLSQLWKVPELLQQYFPDAPTDPELAGDPSIPVLDVTRIY